LRFDEKYKNAPSDDQLGTLSSAVPSVTGKAFPPSALTTRIWLCHAEPLNLPDWIAARHLELVRKSLASFHLPTVVRPR
jgi:hypothetical protein